MPYWFTTILTVLLTLNEILVTALTILFAMVIAEWLTGAIACWRIPFTDEYVYGVSSIVIYDDVELI